MKKGWGRGGGIREKVGEITSGECRNSVVQMLYMTFGKKEKNIWKFAHLPTLADDPSDLDPDPDLAEGLILF